MRFWSMKLDTAFWEVRQAIALTAYFGGLSLVECMDLELEKISRDSEGFTITHTRAKQRSDKITTKFLVPQMGGYANLLAVYLDKVKSQLDRFKGRVWFTGKKNKMLTSQFMGKNSVSKVPHEIAALLKLPDPSQYTFHSFKRTSATRAANAGATTEQLVDFFGWKNASMLQEYISSSKPAILGMANRLSGIAENDKVEQAQEVFLS
jgi:integrase